MPSLFRSVAPWATLATIFSLGSAAVVPAAEPAELSGMLAYDDADLFDSHLIGTGEADPFAPLISPASVEDPRTQSFAPPPCRDAVPMQPMPEQALPYDNSAASNFGSLQAGQGLLTAQSNVSAAASTNVGYIDPAVPMSQFRARFDSAFNSNFPDRAEFFYAQCGCSGGPGPGTPGAAGNNLVDYQEYRLYSERAFNERFSVFAESAIRSIDPDLRNGPTGFNPTDNTSGWGDTQLGFKYALYHDEVSYLTFQGQVYLPTGDADRGLGTNHVSLEPGLLYLRRLSERTTFEAEVKDWIPVDGSDGFAGNVLRYGVGIGHRVYDGPNFTITPVAEFVGWSVLDGMQTDFNEPDGASDANTTIVNAKFGTRVGFGNRNNFLGASRNSLYVGYGTALTGSVWYEDIFRLEYRFLY